MIVKRTNRTNITEHKGSLHTLGGGLDQVHVTEKNHSLKIILSSFRDFYFLGVWGASSPD